MSVGVGVGVVGEIEEQERQLRAAGRVPPGLEAELDRVFRQVAAASLDAAEPGGTDRPGADGLEPTVPRDRKARLAGLAVPKVTAARSRLGPPIRRLERRGVVAAGQMSEKGATKAHVLADHGERVAASSTVATRVLHLVRPGAGALGPAATSRAAIEGPLLTWVLDQLAPGGAGRTTIVHAESGDGRVVAALAARGVDARGADPRLADRRRGGGTQNVAAGALEYLGASAPASLGGLLLSGVVDRLRPGAARALAQLAASRLEPGGTVVVVGIRPEAATALDPVAADLASGRPVHPVTWCHLLARYGLGDLSVFEPDASAPDVFAVAARHPGLGASGPVLPARRA